MDDHRSVSVSRVYVPNEYTVYLSPGDREQFASYEDVAHRRAAASTSPSTPGGRSYALLSPPRVAVETDEDLDVGEFGIATRMVAAEPARAARAGGATSSPARR